MANVNCSSCADLREVAPTLGIEGLNDTMVASLKNNTGLNPSSGNDDCTDLNNMNDCLVGNMASEIEAYEVCDWKTYMKKFIPNVWTTLKGIIASICGLWTKTKALEEEKDNLCALLAAQLRHPVKIYGTTPNLGVAAQQGGVIATKNGVPILTPLARNEVASDSAWLQQNVGFKYGALKTYDCDGTCKEYEWIAPDLYAYRFNADVAPAYDDMLWSVDKTSVLGRMGMSQQMWDTREANPIQWTTDWSAGRAIIALRLSVEDDRFVLRYRGAIGANDSDLAGTPIYPPADQAERLYTFNC